MEVEGALVKIENNVIEEHCFYRSHKYAYINNNTSKNIDKYYINQESSLYMSETNEVILVGILIDDSASIEEFGNTMAVRVGHNSVIKSLKGSEEREKILFSTQLMNKGVLNNWVPLDDAKQLTKENYQPSGDTPLYDATVKLLCSSVAEMQRATIARKKASFSILIISNGEDTSSVKHTATDIKTVVTDIFRHNDPFAPNKIIFMGMPNNRVNYREIANPMGIEDQRTNRRGGRIIQILTPEGDLNSIRRAVDTFTESVKNR